MCREHREHIEAISRQVEQMRCEYDTARDMLAGAVLKIQRHIRAIDAELARVTTHLTGINGHGESVDGQ